MTGFTVIYDANVLYPSILRDVLIRLAGTGIYHARWTEEILDEVFRNLRAHRPDIDPKKLDRTRYLMCKAVDDCLVTDYEGLIPQLSLPDKDDRHVLAAAIRAGAQVIVTENKKDFPAVVLDKYGIEAQSSDEFLCNQIDLFGPSVHQTITYTAAAFRMPPRTIDDVLDALAKSGAPVAASLLRR